MEAPQDDPNRRRVVATDERTSLVQRKGRGRSVHAAWSGQLHLHPRELSRLEHAVQQNSFNPIELQQHSRAGVWIRLQPGHANGGGDIHAHLPFHDNRVRWQLLAQHAVLLSPIAVLNGPANASVRFAVRPNLSLGGGFLCLPHEQAPAPWVWGYRAAMSLSYSRGFR